MWGLIWAGACAPLRTWPANDQRAQERRHGLPRAGAAAHVPQQGQHQLQRSGLRHLHGRALVRKRQLAEQPDACIAERVPGRVVARRMQQDICIHGSTAGRLSAATCPLTCVSRPLSHHCVTLYVYCFWHRPCRSNHNAPGCGCYWGKNCCFSTNTRCGRLAHWMCNQGPSPSPRCTHGVIPSKTPAAPACANSKAVCCEWSHVSSDS